MKEARSRAHLLTHLPKNLYCHVCARAKLNRARTPSVSGSELYAQAKKFGDVVTVDHKISLTKQDQGVGGEVALIIFRLDGLTHTLSSTRMLSKFAFRFKISAGQK